MSALRRFAVGGATRPDGLSGFNSDFSSALAQMFAAAPPEVQSQLQISSGYRSPERQTQLWQGALAKYGSPEAARKWVAPPGKSQHNHGMAADLKYLAPAAKAWAHENASRFGLAFPLGNEDWHIELASARGGTGQPQQVQVAQQSAGTPAAPAPAPAPQVGPQTASRDNPSRLALTPEMAQRAVMAAMAAQQGGGLGQMFAPDPMGAALSGLQQLGRQRQNEDERAQAERARREALFGDLGSMFG